MMQIDSVSQATIRSLRNNETVENFLSRLSRARLTKAERAEIDDIYERLDAEWQAAGHAAPPARAPWTQEDILEWRGLKPEERYLDLKGWAQHVARHGLPGQAAPQPPKAAAPTKLACDGVHVGRGTIWESPFNVGGDGNAHSAIAKYERWLAQQHHLLRALPELRGQTRCPCDRDAHHADLLFALAGKTRDELIVWWRANK
jgi:hypothetical protein